MLRDVKKLAFQWLLEAYSFHSIACSLCQNIIMAILDDFVVSAYILMRLYSYGVYSYDHTRRLCRGRPIYS